MLVAAEACYVIYVDFERRIESAAIDDFWFSIRQHSAFDRYELSPVVI